MATNYQDWLNQYNASNANGTRNGIAPDLGNEVLNNLYRTRRNSEDYQKRLAGGTILNQGIPITGDMTQDNPWVSKSYAAGYDPTTLGFQLTPEQQKYAKTQALSSMIMQYGKDNPGYQPDVQNTLFGIPSAAAWTPEMLYDRLQQQGSTGSAQVPWMSSANPASAIPAAWQNTQRNTQVRATQPYNPNTQRASNGSGITYDQNGNSVNQSAMNIPYTWTTPGQYSPTGNYDSTGRPVDYQTYANGYTEQYVPSVMSGTNNQSTQNHGRARTAQPYTQGKTTQNIADSNDFYAAQTFDPNAYNPNWNTEQLQQYYSNAPGIENVQGGMYYDQNGQPYRMQGNSYWQNQQGQWQQGTPSGQVFGVSNAPFSAAQRAGGAGGNFNATNPNTPTNGTGSSSVTLNQGQSTNYNPQGFQYNENNNPYIDSSGGFSYAALPGMYNYLNQFLGYNANNAAGTATALTDFAGQNITSDYPQGMSEYIQQLVNQLGGSQADFGTSMQQQGANSATNLASGQVPQSDLQQQTSDYLSQLLTESGLTPDYVRAMEESVLKPQQEQVYGQANRSGQGQVAPSSGLTQELQRRNSSDFYNQLVKSGFENRNQNINQAISQGGQTFNQGLNLSQLQGQMGQQGIENSFSAQNQGQNLLNSELGALLGLQGNQQNYASNLSGQYSGLAQNLLGNATTKYGIDNASDSQSASNWGALLASLLSMIGGSKTNPNTPGTVGTPAPGSTRPVLTQPDTRPVTPGTRMPPDVVGEPPSPTPPAPGEDVDTSIEYNLPQPGYYFDYYTGQWKPDSQIDTNVFGAGENPFQYYDYYDQGGQYNIENYMNPYGGGADLISNPDYYGTGYQPWGGWDNWGTTP